MNNSCFVFSTTSTTRSGEAQEGHIRPLRRTMWLCMSPLYVLESLRFKGLDILLRIAEVTCQRPSPYHWGALSGEAQEGHIGPLQRSVWLYMSPLYVLESSRLKGLDILLRIVEVVYEHPPPPAALWGEAQEEHIGPLRRTMWLCMSPPYVFESLRFKGLDILLRFVEVTYQRSSLILPIHPER